MPFAYGPMPRPYTEGPNPVGSFLNTLGGIQQIEAGASKNALMQRELEAEKQVGNIMAGEGTLEEKWEKVMAISPEKAQKMAQSIKAMKPGQLDKIEGLSKWVALTTPQLTSPRPG